MIKGDLKNPRKCNFLGEKNRFVFCQIAMIKPLFNFFKCRRQITIRNRKILSWSLEKTHGQQSEFND